MSHYNNFEAAIRKINARREIPPCYFPGRQGSLFLVGSMGKDMDQHNFWGFHPSPEMSREGQALATLAAKVLINGVMTASEPIPSIENLAADTAESRRLFRVMETNGREIYRQITAESVALHCRKNEERIKFFSHYLAKKAFFSAKIVNKNQKAFETEALFG